MFDENSIAILKRMLESFGPSGFERETTRLITEYMKNYADDIMVDKLGSTVFVAKGSEERPHVLLAGHIDEVGFIVSGIEEKTGFLTFNTLGGWWEQVLLSQRVIVRTRKGDLHGVIAAKPPHLLTEDERRQVMTIDKMYIDIGATSKKEAEDAGVQIGDPVVPWSPFTLIQNGKVAMGKAFDDRIGAFIIMELIRNIKQKGIAHPNTVFGAATVQEELGGRGARTISQLVDPDVGIVLEVDISGDAPGIKPSEAPTKIGKGPTLYTYDSSMIPNQPLKEFVIQIAQEAKIPLQLSLAKGGTDAGLIHLNRVGCPSVVISVSTRHIHSHVGLLNLKDAENAVKLLCELVKRLDKKTVENFTAL